MVENQVLTEKIILFLWLYCDMAQTDSILFDNGLAVKEYENYHLAVFVVILHSRF